MSNTFAVHISSILAFSLFRGNQKLGVKRRWQLSGLNLGPWFILKESFSFKKIFVSTQSCKINSDLLIYSTIGNTRRMVPLNYITAPMYWRIAYSIRLGDARKTQKIHKISIFCVFVPRMRSALPIQENNSCSTNILCGMAVYFVLTRGDLQRRE